MKRSKLFLGATTCLLGIAAFAASKAKSHPTVCTIGRATSAIASGSCETVNGSNLTTGLCTNSSAKTLYTNCSGTTLQTLFKSSAE